MNQILLTEKLYVTPELKRKRAIYKLYFFLCIFLIGILFSFYIYAEYDRSKGEEAGKQLLSSINFKKNAELTEEEEEIWTFVLGEGGDSVEEVSIPQEEVQEQIEKEIMYSEGEPYYTIATLTIPKIDLEYVVFSRTSDALLKISPTRFRGPDPNEVGNLCIVGHNYRNRYFFSKVPILEIGDTLNLTDEKGRTVTYQMYDTYVVDPNDSECLNQDTNGKREVTLITCTNDGENRVVCKFREKK